MNGGQEMWAGGDKFRLAPATAITVCNHMPGHGRSAGTGSTPETYFGREKGIRTSIPHPELVSPSTAPLARPGI